MTGVLFRPVEDGYTDLATRAVYLSCVSRIPQYICRLIATVLFFVVFRADLRRALGGGVSHTHGNTVGTRVFLPLLFIAACVVSSSCIRTCSPRLSFRLCVCRGVGLETSTGTPAYCVGVASPAPVGPHTCNPLLLRNDVRPCCRDRRSVVWRDAFPTWAVMILVPHGVVHVAYGWLPLVRQGPCSPLWSNGTAGVV